MSASSTSPQRLEDVVDALAPDVLDRMNSDFEDSVLLVGRVLGGRPSATATTMDAVTLDGVRATVVDADGEHPLDLAFDEPIADVSQLTTNLLGLVSRARRESGEDGMTSAEVLMAALNTVRTFVVEVVEVRHVHAHLRSITFGGVDLASFAPLGPDTFLYVLLPPRGRRDLTIDQSFTWERYEQMPDEERPTGAYYTVRAWDPERCRIEMLFVLHGDEGDASSWATHAAVGDRVALWGPRTSFEPPADTEWYLLVADDTGLPATAVILETLPAHVPVVAVIEVDSEDDHIELAQRPGVEVVWVHRRGRPAGTDATPVLDAVRGLALPPGRGYVWGGGESRMMTAVRKYVRGEVGLERAQVALVAYWRHATSPADRD